MGVSSILMAEYGEAAHFLHLAYQGHCACCRCE